MAKPKARNVIALVVLLAVAVVVFLMARKFCPLFQRREMFAGHHIPIIKCKYVCEQNIPGTHAHAKKHGAMRHGIGGMLGMPPAVGAIMPANAVATAAATGNAPAPPPNAPVTCVASGGWSPQGSAVVGGIVTQACPDGSVNTATCGANGQWTIGGCPGTAALTAATVPGAATPVPGIQGRYIKLQNTGVHCAHFAEIEVFSSSGGANLAAQAVVTMSSQFGNNPGSNMVDNSLTTWAGTSCNEVPWILVDMGNVITIYSIELTNRQDCCQGRANGTVLTILDANQNVVYTANPIVDTNGSSAYRDDAASAFNVFTYLPPSVAVVGE
jgi:hypothetical protein